MAGRTRIPGIWIATILRAGARPSVCAVVSAVWDYDFTAKRRRMTGAEVAAVYVWRDLSAVPDLLAAEREHWHKEGRPIGLVFEVTEAPTMRQAMLAKGLRGRTITASAGVTDWTRNTVAEPELFSHMAALIGGRNVLTIASDYTDLRGEVAPDDLAAALETAEPCRQDERQAYAEALPVHDIALAVALAATIADRGPPAGVDLAPPDYDQNTRQTRARGRKPRRALP